MLWIAVAMGGALGSMARHFVNMEITRYFEKSVPYATFTVNVIGCIVIGTLAGRIAAGRLELSPAMRVFIFTGILGGFTTFSSLGLDSVTLFAGGNYRVAIWNLVGQLAIGIGGAYAAFRLTA